MDNSDDLIVCYSRVSTHDQKKDLVTQEQKLLSYAQQLPNSKPENIISISDLGSGLNYKKKGLKQLLNLILLGESTNLNHQPQRQIIAIWI